MFKRSSTSVLLFARVALIQNGAPNCASPATNTAGNTSTVLIGNLTNVTTTDFKAKLTVPNVDQLPLPLDNFKSTIKRGSVFRPGV